MKKILVLSAAILFIAAACNKQAAVQPAQNQTTVNSNQPTESSTADWKTYTNEQYGFELKLPELFNGYQIKNRTDIVYKDVIYIDIQIPVSSKEGGMASPLGIAVYPIKTWATVSAEGGPIPNYIMQNDLYVFAYFGWQDPPISLIGKDFKISQIISTFKFTK